jgi:hypothetical protein
MLALTSPLVGMEWCFLEMRGFASTCRCLPLFAIPLFRSGAYAYARLLKGIR